MTVPPLTSGGLIVPVAPDRNTVDPVPDIVPALHANVPETSSSPAPLTVPPVIVNAPTVPVAPVVVKVPLES